VVAAAGHQLAARRLGALEHLGDLGVVHVEHVVQQERGALEWGQPLEGHQQRVRQVLGERVRLGGIGALDDRLGQPGADVVLAPRARRLHPVEAQPRGGAREERPGLGHGGAVGGVPAQERVLCHVLRLGDRAEHAIGQPDEEPAMRLEAGGGVRHRHRGTSPPRRDVNSAVAGAGYVTSLPRMTHSA
jgi:hypothetical protein